MPHLTKAIVTARNCNGDSFTHQPGTVLSDWELSDFIREKIKEGSEHYRNLFEPLTDKEAHGYRVKATESEAPHIADGQPVAPPWDDFIGLHPSEVVDRMRESTPDKVAHVRKYERGGMNRAQITEFVHPAEHEPFAGYDQMELRDILEKFSISSDPDVASAIAYEKANKNRPAVVEWDRETELGTQTQTVQTGVGA